MYTSGVVSAGPKGERYFLKMGLLNIGGIIDNLGWHNLNSKEMG